MRALIVIGSAVAGSWVTITVQRYGPALLWTIFSRGDR